MVVHERGKTVPALLIVVNVLLAAHAVVGAIKSPDTWGVVSLATILIVNAIGVVINIKTINL